MLENVMWMKRGFACVALLMALATPAATTLVGDGLAPGPHAVGFTTLAEFDATRTWLATRNYRGEFTADSRGRPVLVNVWYPAAPHARGKPMSFSAYVVQSAPPELRALAAAMEERSRQNLEGAVAAEQRQTLRALPVRARAHPRPAPGPFPVVLYFGGLNAEINANFLIGEFLASHGYVFASISQVGASDQSPAQSREPDDIELAVRDMEFALGLLVRQTNADRARIFVMGHSVGAVQAAVLAARNGNVRAMVGLDGTYGFAGSSQVLMNAHGFSAQRLRAPVLDLRRAQGEQDARLDDTAIASLRHSERDVVQLQHMHHSDFTSFAVIADEFAIPTHARYAGSGWDRHTGRRGYETAGEIVLAFLEEQIRQAPAAEAHMRAVIARGDAAHSHLAALPAPLSPEEALELAASDDGERARSWLRSCAGDASVAACVNAERFNSTGYERLGRGQPREALTLFQIVAWANPRSANAEDSLADAWLALGEKAAARAAIQRSIELAALDPSLAPAARDSFIADARHRLELVPGGKGGN
jgi:dienelactone hydrolase